jgi:antitoxin HicB
MTNERSLEYFMALPHKVEIAPTEDGVGFTASIPDLKGCMAFGETVEEAYEMVTEVKEAWIGIALEEGWSIPEPREEEVKAYSGRFNVRLPRYLHRRLAEVAEAEDTSLNQLVVALLSEGVERRRGQRRSRQFFDLVRSSRAVQAAMLEPTLERWLRQARTTWQCAEELARIHFKEGNFGEVCEYGDESRWAGSSPAIWEEAPFSSLFLYKAEGKSHTMVVSNDEEPAD